MNIRMDSAPANLVAAQTELVNAQDQLDALHNPDGEMIATAQKGLVSAYSNWNTARATLSSALSGRSSDGDDELYDDMTSAETDVNDALDAFALSANPDAQWYYWAARMSSLYRSGDYDYVDLAASLRGKLDSDDADLVDDIVDAQNKYEAAVQDFAESITDYDVAVIVNDSVTSYQQTAEALLSTTESAYETIVTPNPKDLTMAQTRIDAARASLDTLYITAPFAGEVLAVEQVPGDVISPGAVAVTLADRSNLYIEAQVDEADIAQVAVGNPVTIELDAMPGETLEGTVTHIKPVGDLVAGVIKFSVRVELDPTSEPVLLGATANLTIQTSDPSPALAVPVSAVQSDSSGEYVTVVEADGSTRRVNVQSSDSVGDLVVVTGDLQAGDRVQTDYQSNMESLSPFGN